MRNLPVRMRYPGGPSLRRLRRAQVVRCRVRLPAVVSACLRLRGHGRDQSGAEPPPAHRRRLHRMTALYVRDVPWGSTRLRRAGVRARVQALGDRRTVERGAAEAAPPVFGPAGQYGRATHDHDGSEVRRAREHLGAWSWTSSHLECFHGTRTEISNAPRTTNGPPQETARRQADDAHRQRPEHVVRAQPLPRLPRRSLLSRCRAACAQGSAGRAQDAGGSALSRSAAGGILLIDRWSRSLPPPPRGNPGRLLFPGTFSPAGQ